jgi:Tol biopolymer transport system component
MAGSLLALGVMSPAQARPETVTLVSVSSTGELATGASSVRPAASSDGRFVAFVSDAANLVAGDGNGVADVFLRDRVAGTTTLVSVASGGGVGNGPGRWVSISGDGRYVAFSSEASDLVPDDTNAVSDVFVRDIAAGTTRRVSVTSEGAQLDGWFDYPSISGDGRLVAFDASTLGLGGNGGVALYDQATGQTRLVADNTLDNFCSSGFAALSADGSRVAYQASERIDPFLCGGGDQVVVEDIASGSWSFESRTSGGELANDVALGPALDADGDVLVFMSLATNLLPAGSFTGRFNVFRRDLRTGTTTLVSARDGVGPSLDSTFPAVDGSGNRVVFTSRERFDGSLPGYSDVWLWEAGVASIRLASFTERRRRAEGDSRLGVLALDGTRVALVSAAPLVRSDTNGVNDVYLTKLDR